MNKMNKKGFTLAELLIVVAIIGVLTAIAIPVFSSQLEKSREATDKANVRSAYADVMAQYLTNADSGYSMKVTPQQTQTGWQGESGFVMTQVDGKESSVTYSAITKSDAKSYVVSIAANGSLTISAG